MSNNLIERLTAQFYDWEQRGRGRLMFDVPVRIEPAYVPFVRQIQPNITTHDDGRKHSAFTWIKDKLFGTQTTAQLISTEETPFALPYESREQLVALKAILPKERENTLAQTEQFLTILSQIRNPVNFDIIASQETIYLQWVVRESDFRFVYGQLQIFFPYLAFLPEYTEQPLSSEKESHIVDLGLEQEFILPLATYNDRNVDSLTGLFGILESLRGDEQAALQILFQGTSYSWTNSIISSVTDYDGTSFFLDAPTFPKYAQQKVSAPLFGVCVRVMAQSSNRNNARNIAESLAYSLCNVSASPVNSLCPLSGERYQAGEHYTDVINRESRRLGMLLNSAELTQLLHLPTETLSSHKFEEQCKTKSAPQLGAGIQLGVNVHQGITQEVTVPNTHRMKHTHIIGATGTGKSTLLLNLITEDILSGNGLAVLDPHGDLIDAVLSRIPEHKQQDVVVIDPSDAQYSVGFNILSAHSEIEKDILASDLVSVFKRLSTSWGDQMNSVLANAILALLESKGGTLLDLRHFLLDKAFRETILKDVTDPHITYYWRKEYPLLKSSSVGSILTRLDGFLRPKAIRNIVGQKRSINFEDTMDNKKILLIKLSQGLIGTENSYLLGSLFVTKIYQTALARQAKGEILRNDFFLYVDEFQNFVTPSMANILSGARKYRLGLVLAHQDMQQLVRQDAELANSVLSNCGTRICFRLGDSDAKKFEEGFSYFNASDIQNLAVGEAIARFNGSNSDFNLSVTQQLVIEETNATQNRETIIALSNQKYATPISDLVFSTPLETTPEAEPEKPKKETPPKTERKVEEEYAVTYTSQETVQPVSEDKQQQLVDDLVRRKEASRHRYLQTLIKRMAEARGYIAQIELPTPDGKGRVDVSLEKNGKRIACEIGITTTKEWEIHNVEKCLNAGYDLVIACTDEQKAVNLMQRKITELLDKSQQEKVAVFLPEDLFAFLDMEAAKEQQPEEKRMKGYRIKTEHTTTSLQENQRKRESVIKTIVDAFRKE